MRSSFESVPVMRELYRLYFTYPGGISDATAASLLRLRRQQVYRLRQRMPGVYEVSRGLFSCRPTPEQIEMARVILLRNDYEKLIDLKL